MGTIQEVVALLEARKQEAARLKTAIASGKDTAVDLIGGFRSLGLEGPAVTKLERAEERLKDAFERIDHAENLIEAARLMANSAEGGLTGTASSSDTGAANSSDSAPAPTVSVTTDSTAAPADPAALPDSSERPPTGEELLRSSEPEQRGLSGLVRAAMNPDTMDSAKSLTESAANVADAFEREFGPPMTEENTRTETQVPAGPRFEAPSQPQVGAGDVAMGFVALSVVVAKGRQTISKFIGRWIGRTREHRG